MSDQMPKLVEPESGQRLTLAGLGVTIVWLSLFALFTWRRWGDVAELKPNEIGDFLAGAFAPLAFFWLVLGFFQQGSELRNSGRALWLQGEELQNSVQQQRDLVAVTREQLQFESDRLKAEAERVQRLAQPRLELLAGGFYGGNGYREQSFSLLNHGRPCTRVAVAIDGVDRSFSFDRLESGKRQDFSFQLKKDFSSSRVRVGYLDELQNEGETFFTVEAEGNALLIRPSH